MKKILLLIILLSLSYTIQAATLTGSVYNSNLELEQDVLLELSTTPVQKYLSKDGTYSFELSNGQYTLTARKGFIEVTEAVVINTEGTFVLDLFLLPDLTEETELYQDTEEELLTENFFEEIPWWSYVITGVVIVILLARFLYVRKKHGSLREFRQRVVEESVKTVENHPEYLDQALEIIKKHEGRIHQKNLRQELLHLSEAKVSLIVSELEHKGKIEKFKKGRGNIIILK